MTAHTVNRFNVVNRLLRVDDLRTPQATTTVSSHTLKTINNYFNFHMEITKKKKQKLNLVIFSYFNCFTHTVTSKCLNNTPF